MNRVSGWVLVWQRHDNIGWMKTWLEWKYDMDEPWHFAIIKISFSMPQGKNFEWQYK